MHFSSLTGPEARLPLPSHPVQTGLSSPAASLGPAMAPAGVDF